MIRFLRVVLLSLLASLITGLIIGTIIRLRMETPPVRYLVEWNATATSLEWHLV